MLRGLLSFLFGLILIAGCPRAAVLLQIEINAERTVEFAPIECLIRIQHLEQERVDDRSFRLEGQPLAAEFLNDSLHSSITIVNGVRKEDRFLTSVYRFYLPGVASGEYVLPPVSVVVGGRRHISEQVAYFVYSGQTSDRVRLRAFIRGEPTLYPGQRAEFVYHFVVKGLIDPLVQHLPLCEAQGFRKLGEPKLVSTTHGDHVVQEIIQEVQAIAPGEYVFGPSFVEGNAYRRDFFGRRIYDQQRLRAEVEPITVIVAPFPEVNKPACFQGALGNFQISSKLLSPSQVMVGDRLRLELTIAGEGVLSTVRPPELALDSRFMHDFRFSDLPPTVKESAECKRFIFEMRPLNSAVSSIPSVDFCSFDPGTQTYVTGSTAPLAITVSPSPSASSNSLLPVSMKSHSLDEVGSQPSSRLMEICGCMTVSTSERDAWPHWWFLWIFPITAVVWCVQWLLRRRLTERSLPDVLTGPELLSQARVYWHVDRSRSIRDLEAALLLRLYEKGHVADVRTVETLASSGLEGQIRDMLTRLQGSHYGQACSNETEHLLREVESLWVSL